MSHPFMEAAARLAFVGMAQHAGGPFGAVVVRGEEIIGSGHNRVLLDCDPSAHAEVVAIRDACKALGQFHLTDDDFVALTKLLLESAAAHCQNRLISVLEGGYNLKGLASAVASHVGALL